MHCEQGQTIQNSELGIPIGSFIKAVVQQTKELLELKPLCPQKISHKNQYLVDVVHILFVKWYLVILNQWAESN